MPTEHSAGVIVYFLGDGPPKYLLLHHGDGHWSFPKGNVESGESDEQAALRELSEETGIIHVFLVKGFKQDTMYYYTRGKEAIHKTVTYLLAASPTKGVTLSTEHIGFRWLPFNSAHKLVNFPNQKDLLTKAHQWVTTKPDKTESIYSGHAAIKRVPLAR